MRGVSRRPLDAAAAKRAASAAQAKVPRGNRVTILFASRTYGGDTIEETEDRRAAEAFEHRLELIAIRQILARLPLAVRRRLRAARKLRSRGLTWADAAAELGVSRKTLQRDREMLEEALRACAAELR